ncbi:MAG: hypothetical protein GXO43_09555 [Crenarchaeota archaeon]|nr:hypothetical protein [Thermoproteota archaeon]
MSRIIRLKDLLLAATLLTITVSLVVAVPAYSYISSNASLETIAVIRSWTCYNFFKPVGKIQSYLNTIAGDDIEYVPAKIPDDNALIIYVGIATDKIIDKSGKLTFGPNNSQDVGITAVGGVFYRYANSEIVKNGIHYSFKLYPQKIVFRLRKVQANVKYTFKATVKASTKAEAEAYLESKLNFIVGSAGFTIKYDASLSTSTEYTFTVTVTVDKYYSFMQALGYYKFEAWSNLGYDYGVVPFNTNVTSLIPTVVELNEYNVAKNI